jgi:hypothetical protein
MLSKWMWRSGCGEVEKTRSLSSVADPGCLSRIPDLGSRILIFTHPGSRIPDPKTVTKERGEKKFVILFFVVANFTKLNIVLFLKC